MPHLNLLAIVSISLAFAACSKKLKSESGAYAPAVLSDDAVPVITAKPTNPNGGTVEGKGLSISPEEGERRRNKNLIEPIIFGDKVAGISMAMPQSEALGILSPRFDSFQGVDFFAEHLRIVWDGGSDPQPFLIGIDPGYAGTMKLPAPYGDVTIGQNMDAFLVTFADLQQFLLSLGAQFENQAPGYDCEKALTCQQTESEDAYILDFRRGGVRLSKQAGLPLSFVYFSQPQKFFARPLDPIVYGISVAGLTFQSKRTVFEARVGPPTATNDAGYFFYDRESVGVRWNNLGNPLSMEVLGTYQGPLIFGGTVGTRKIGDSFAEYAPSTDDGTLLIQVLDRLLNKRVDPNFNCLTATPTALCQLTIDTTSGFIQMQMDRNSFLFTTSADRRWIQYLVNAP